MTERPLSVTEAGVLLLTPPTKEGTLGEDDRRTAESGGKQDLQGTAKEDSE